MDRTIEVVAHRGANGVAPENTRAAVARCLDFGVDVIELDVRRSLDGVLYNLHDATLDRTTNGGGLASLRTSGYIDGLDAGGWFSPEFVGELVAEAHRHGLRVMANCGRSGEEAFVRIVESGVDMVNLDRPHDFAAFVRANEG